ncbi:MAG: PilN domain-containing protein [Candidatus Tyrphobacter sp.]
MRIDYLRDASPDAVARLREAFELPQVRRLCSFLLAAIVIDAAGWAIERGRVDAAGADLATLAQRVNRADLAAARVRGEEKSLRTWQSAYEYVARARDSGAAMSTRIALLANELPPQTWLTSLEVGSDGVALDGRGLDLGDVGDALRAVSASRLVEVRAPSDPHSRILEFEMRSAR